MQSALVCARQTGRRIGDVLLAQKLVHPEELQCALDVQKLIKEGTLTVELGTKALREFRIQPAPLSALLAAVGYCDVKTIRNNDLADILVDSEAITDGQLDQASWNAGKNNMPLGRNLVLSGAISPSTLGAALTLLTHLRERSITEEEAIAALKQVLETHLPLSEVISLPSTISPHHVRVGELLAQAGLLSESDAMMAAEQGLMNRQCIGQALLHYKLISPLVLDAVLKLQGMLEEGTIPRSQAPELLRQVADKEIALEDCLTAMARLRAQVLELLLDSRLITEMQVQEALAASPAYETDILRALFTAGFLNQETFRSTVRCAYAINEGAYTKDKALAWLRYTFVEEKPADDSEMKVTA
jgi:hypothetical protein